MEKKITIGTTLKDNPTNISYAIVELLKDGFNCKPKTSAKNIQHEKYTFEEIQSLFKEGTIDIEGFEHNEADDRLVFLIIEGYIKDSLINEYKSSLSDTITDKTSIESSLNENELLMKQREETITDQEQTIHDQSNEISELRIIKSERDLLKTELENVKIELDSVRAELVSIKASLDFRTTELQVKSQQLNDMTAALEKEKSDRTAEKELWEKEKLEYENTIQGMEIANQ